MEKPEIDTPHERPGPAAAAIRSVQALSGADLGMAVAREVMDWHADHEEYTDCWVDGKGKLTGYYYGRPFSPYRDRNALAEVWKRIDALDLREAYLEALDRLLADAAAGGEAEDGWLVHTANPEIACRAALVAVREKRPRE